MRSICVGRQALHVSTYSRSLGNAQSTITVSGKLVSALNVEQSQVHHTFRKQHIAFVQERDTENRGGTIITVANVARINDSRPHPGSHSLLHSPSENLSRLTFMLRA